MEFLDAIVQRVTRWGLALGGFILVVAMLLQVGNILGRFAHFVIPGSFETFEMIMVIPIGFGLVYAALERGHVVVDLVVSRFSRKIRAAAHVVAAFLSLATWAAITYAGTKLAIENGLEEVTDILEYPVLPFRVIFIICLILFCLAYLIELSRSLRRFLDK